MVGYPEYLKRFFENYFKMMAFKTISSEEEDAEDNKEKELILSFPLQTYKSPDKKNVVIPLVFEGDSEPKEGSKNKRRLILERIKVLARTEVKWNEKSNIDKISCLFIYDADEKGVLARQDEFKSLYADHVPENFSMDDWIKSQKGEFFMAHFVWTDGKTGKGTLEDSVSSMFRQKDEALFEEVNQQVRDWFKQEDPNESKIQKAVLTTCGQVRKGFERRSKGDPKPKFQAGYSLVSIIQNTYLLDDNVLKTNLESSKTQEGQLFILIEKAIDIPKKQDSST